MFILVSESIYSVDKFHSVNRENAVSFHGKRTTSVREKILRFRINKIKLFKEIIPV